MYLLLLLTFISVVSGESSKEKQSYYGYYNEKNWTLEFAFALLIFSVFGSDLLRLRPFFIFRSQKFDQISNRNSLFLL